MAMAKFSSPNHKPNPQNLSENKNKKYIKVKQHSNKTNSNP